MRQAGGIVLTVVIVSLAGGPGHPACPDPEPPPPVKVSVLKGGVKVKVRSGAGGPLLEVDAGGGRGTHSLQLDFTEKNAPARITLRFKETEQLAIFGVMGMNKAKKGDRAIARVTGQGKQTFHFDADGVQLMEEKGARLSITYAPGQGQVEVVVVRHKGKAWPKPPLRVVWAQTLKKK